MNHTQSEAKKDSQAESSRKFSKALARNVVFNKLFGEEGTEAEVLSFLNDILAKTQKEPLVEIKTVDSLEPSKLFFEEKIERIDVRAKSESGGEVNIVVQFAEEKNILGSVIFCSNKLFFEKKNQGEDYQVAEKMILINLMDFEMVHEVEHCGAFKCLKGSEHGGFSDFLEILFVKIPKSRRDIGGSCVSLMC